MQKLHFSIKINAPKEKIWRTMLDDKTYRDWTSVFAKGSHYQGSWDKGSKIKFFDGEGNGMTSEIAESKPYNFISIRHLGVIEDGKEDTTKDWSGALENYTFKEENGATELQIDMDSEDDYVEMMNKMWPKALQRLKGLAES